MQFPKLLEALAADVIWDQMFYKWAKHKAKVRVVGAESGSAA